MLAETLAAHLRAHDDRAFAYALPVVVVHAPYLAGQDKGRVAIGVGDTSLRVEPALAHFLEAQG